MLHPASMLVTYDYTLPGSAAGTTLFFGCGVLYYCAAGMKVAIPVMAA